MVELDQTTFAQEAAQAGEALSPLRAGLLLARECAYPGLRPSDYVVQVEDLALAAQAALAGVSDPQARGLALAEFLFGAYGLRGNADNYADPRNSYLNQVLDRRLGIPISLSVIYLEVGARLGLPVAGVGLPGHFIVRAGGADQPAYLDPFHGGRVLSRDDCRELVRSAAGLSGAFDPAWLAPTPPRNIVARMLNNLRAFYISVEDWSLAIAMLERLVLLQPDVPGHVRDLGVLHYRAGSFRQASRLLDDYLKRAPQAADADTVRRGRDLMLEELARLN
ncbi:MAG: transglutaminase family protein [Anaerolineales bacterium]|nr:transglutaminase family protein [Anaerolineales bacterium]